MIPKKWFTRAWLALGWASAASATFLFLAFSSHSFQEVLGKWQDPAQKYYPFVLFVLVLGSLSSSALYVIFRRWESITVTPVVAPPRPKWNFSILGLVALAAIAFLLSVSQMHAPLDWDEVARSSEMARGNTLSVIHPFTTMNHPIATVLSWLSMKGWGATKIGVRLPALGFALAFLALVIFEGRVWLTTFTLCLILSHFAANELVVWYMHSMRGYISMMLFTGAIFFLVLDALKSGEFSPKKQLTLSLLVGACLFTHTFAAVFCLVFALSLLTWLALNLKTVSPEVIDTGARILLVFLAWIPIMGLVMGFHVLVLDQTGFIHPPPAPGHLPPFFALTRGAMVLGTPRLWFVKILFLGSLALLAWKARRGELIRDFLSLHIVLTALFVGISLWILDAAVLEGRMLLAFLLPFLVWIGENVKEIRPSRLRAMVSAGILLWFTIPPLLCAKGLMAGDLQHFADLEHFSSETIARLGRVPKHCLYYAGDPDSIHYTRYFYLFNQPEQGACPARYLLFFGKGQFGARHPLDPKVRDSVTPLFSDGKGRVLYEFGPNPLSSKIVSR